MNRLSLAKYALGGVSGVAGILIVTSTSKIDIPSCSNSKVLSSVVTLWKQQEIMDQGRVQDGRLKDPYEVPLKISNGRSCSSELLINGQPSGSISYTVMRPLRGAAGMVTLD